jgi:hypothetical protein
MESLQKSVAMGILNAEKNHSNNPWPPDCEEFGKIWNRVRERDCTKSEFALAIKEFRELKMRGVSPQQFEDAFHAAAFFDGMSVTHPLGCAYVVEDIRLGVRNTDGSKKDKKNGKIRMKPSADGHALSSNK